MSGDHKHNFYGGADYGLNPEYSSNSLGLGGKYSAGVFAMPTDPRTSNQIKAVSDKLNTGAKVIEVSAITPETLDYIPKQHFEELRKLKKLTGAELTLHGPLVEATGMTQRGWDEFQRQQVERQMYSAVEKAKELGENTVVTFHSSNGLPEPESKSINPSTGKETIEEMYVIDGRGGELRQIKPKENFLLNKKEDAKAELVDLNKEIWTKQLSSASYHAQIGKQAILSALGGIKAEMQDGEVDFGDKSFAEIYKLSNTAEGQKLIESTFPDQNVRNLIEKRIHSLNYGELNLRDAYNDLQKQFNSAWETVQKNGSESDKKRMKDYQTELAKKPTNFFEDPNNLTEFAEEVSRGIKLLGSLSKTPEIYRPLREFAIDKASDTFGNVAFSAYSKFGSSAPIISIENPPAGSGLNRAQDLKEVVDESRKKFVAKAMEEKGLSESEAKKEAEKLIGVTWDVGHINMIRKFGSDETKLISETKTIAPYVKHIHLSDNFGLEHTELPMGMGNVPIKKHLEELQKAHGDKMNEIKQVIETGGWFQHFKRSPLPETLSAFGSPIYSMKMAPTWGQAYGTNGGYFGGYGQMLPEGNFSMYGAGFSGLPSELGGQMGNRNRLSGAPME